MMKKRKKLPLIVLSIIVVCLLGIHNKFFTINGIKGQELLSVTDSSDGKYSVSMYLNNGGATTSYAVLGTLTNNETKREKNIYWEYKCTEGVVDWLDETTVDINGIVLDVTKDSYDFRQN